jgi:hypothetical protein
MPYKSLQEVLPMLLEKFEPIGLLMWFCAPNAALNGAEPRSVIADSARLNKVVKASLTPLESW